MSAATQDPFASVSFITRDVYLNAMLVQTLGTGMYTILFLYTIWIMMSNAKFRRPHRPLIAAIIALYLLITLTLALEWYLLRQMYVVFGDTSADETNYLYVIAPLWLDMLPSTAFYAAALVADAIMVWRCFILWGHNWYIKSLLIVAWTAELAMAIFGLWGEANPVNIADLKASPGNIWLGMSLATTVICTLLIVFRILRMGLFTPSSPYKSIIIIVCESAALYSVALIIFIPMYVSTNVTVNFDSEYMKRIVVCIAGIAPTLMAARIASADERPTQTWTEGDVEFGSVPTDIHTTKNTSITFSGSRTLGPFEAAAGSIVEKDNLEK